MKMLILIIHYLILYLEKENGCLRSIDECCIKHNIKCNKIQDQIKLISWNLLN
jgi:hypothetical protein